MRWLDQQLGVSQAGPQGEIREVDGAGMVVEDEVHPVPDASEFGERKPKAARRPYKPTQAEIDEHYPLHVHYRSWCPHRNAGKSIGRQHTRSAGNEERMGVTISIDYAFMTPEDAEEGVPPILVACDDSTDAVWAMQVDSKGVEAGVGVDWLFGKLEFAGYSGMRITIKSDQEPSIMALKRAMVVKRAAETCLVESPVRESKSNGKVERAIRTWRDQFRTLRHYYEHRVGDKLALEGPLSSWLVSWASEVLNKYKVRDSGRTSYEIITGHRTKHVVVGFGEKIFFQHSSVDKSGFRRDVGIFLGMSERNNTFLVGNQHGVYGSSHIMRMVDDEACDKGMTAEFSRSFYDYLKDGIRQPPAMIVANGGGVSNPDPLPVEPTKGGYAPRRASITKDELRRFGYTAGCPGCLTAQLDDGLRRAPHNAACRLRMEALMSEDKRDRASKIINQWLSDKIEEGAVEKVQKTPVKPAEAVKEPERASGSGLTTEERKATPTLHAEADFEEDGQVPVDTDMTEHVETGHADDVLDDGPNRASDVRLGTPERRNPIKRRIEDDKGLERLRQKISTPEQSRTMDARSPSDDGMEQGTSPATRWWRDDDVPREIGDANMDLLDEVDKNILASIILGVDICEVFSPERVNAMVRKFGLTPGSSLDLTNGYDFRNADDRARAWAIIKKTSPYLVIGSPPCTLFSQLQELNKHIHRDDPVWLRKFEEAKAEATSHLVFCAMIYQHRMKHGRHFLHEHPWSAASWKLTSMAELIDDGRVFHTQTHMCRFGMESHVQSKGGEKGLVKKPTGFMSSAECIVAELARRCDGSHQHVHLMGGRAAAAQVYPPALWEAILRGVIEQKRFEQGRVVTTPTMEPQKFISL